MGLPIGFQYHASTYASGAFDVYWYEKNLQGDIVAVYDQAGNMIVSYRYDAWGNCTKTNIASSVPAVVTNNPFRYRGYYYDLDLWLYYLNSRYYDSNTGRFISPDSLGYLGANGDLKISARTSLHIFMGGHASIGVNISDFLGGCSINENSAQS